MVLCNLTKMWNVEIPWDINEQSKKSTIYTLKIQIPKIILQKLTITWNLFWNCVALDATRWSDPLNLVIHTSNQTEGNIILFFVNVHTSAKNSGQFFSLKIHHDVPDSMFLIQLCMSCTLVVISCEFHPNHVDLRVISEILKYEVDVNVMQVQ